MIRNIAAALLATTAATLVAPAALAQSEAPLPMSEEEQRSRADIIVVGEVDHTGALPGSATVVSEEDLARSRAFTVLEALRQVPGLFARDEEGVGIRPNIGVRGLTPIR